MPLWIIVALLLIYVAGTVLSWRTYIRGGDPFFLSAGIMLLTLSLVAYAAVTRLIWM